ncbi:MAG: hypothetical protein FJ030_05250 [Chloroflexi bacterium]|nr:hypothetical protein [Chloroflexota bacterium]
MPNDDFVWTVRTFIYQHFAATTRAPGLGEIARHFGLSAGQAGETLTALHEKHALFLEPGTLDIRIANPFSAIPTPFEVEADGKRYWANCAWDSFGIPAALHATEAAIRSVCAHSGAPLSLSVKQGRAVSSGEVVHFLVPFQRWYEDMTFT